MRIKVRNIYATSPMLKKRRVFLSESPKASNRKERKKAKANLFKSGGYLINICIKE